MSRGTSANTTILRDAPEALSPRPSVNVAPRNIEHGGRRRLSSLQITSPTVQSPNPSTNSIREEAVSPGPAESTSNDDSSNDESSPAQSRIIRRPPRFQSQEAVPQYDDDGDDESEPAFRVQASGQDMVSTLRGNAKGAAPTSTKTVRQQLTHHSTTSDESSASSPSAVHKDTQPRDAKPPGPLSPRRTAELAGRSPSGKGKGTSQEGSDGTPSMGSSFSDLDGKSPRGFQVVSTANAETDASVTQSALEEALASHMKGAASSRFSISQAFRSRYAPGSNQ